MSIYPKVIATSVIRSTFQGESHGGIYIIDFMSDSFHQVLDWDKMDINWEGRGLDRGLRGISIENDRVYIAASDEIFIYDQKFEKIGSIKNKYLKHCHEIFVSNDILYMTSTGYDSILLFDLNMNQFTKGYCLKFNKIKAYANRLNIKKLKLRIMKYRPDMELFDPNSNGGPAPMDSVHLNNVFVENESIYVSGTHIGKLLRIKNDQMDSIADLPYFTHNAKPLDNLIIANETAKNRISIRDKQGGMVEAYDIPLYAEDKLKMKQVPKDHARQAFARGLVHNRQYIFGGSSPATVSMYKIGQSQPYKSVNLTMDIRNAIHGLEIWPY